MGDLSLKVGERGKGGRAGRMVSPRKSKPDAQLFVSVRGRDSCYWEDFLAFATCLVNSFSPFKPGLAALCPRACPHLQTAGARCCREREWSGDPLRSALRLEDVISPNPGANSWKPAAQTLEFQSSHAHNLALD